MLAVCSVHLEMFAFMYLEFPVAGFCICRAHVGFLCGRMISQWSVLREFARSFACFRVVCICVPNVLFNVVEVRFGPVPVVFRNGHCVVCMFLCLRSSSGFAQSGSSQHVVSEGPPHWRFVLTTFLDAAGSNNVTQMRAVPTWRPRRRTGKVPLLRSI